MQVKDWRSVAQVIKDDWAEYREKEEEGHMLQA